MHASAQKMTMINALNTALQCNDVLGELAGKGMI